MSERQGGQSAEIGALDTITRWANRNDVAADRLQETPEFLRGYRAALDDLRALLAARRQRVTPPEGTDHG